MGGACLGRDPGNAGGQHQSLASEPAPGRLRGCIPGTEQRDPTLDRGTCRRRAHARRLVSPIQGPGHSYGGRLEIRWVEARPCAQEPGGNGNGPGRWSRRCTLGAARAPDAYPRDGGGGRRRRYGGRSNGRPALRWAVQRAPGPTVGGPTGARPPGPLFHKSGPGRLLDGRRRKTGRRRGTSPPARPSETEHRPFAELGRSAEPGAGHTLGRSPALRVRPPELEPGAVARLWKQ
jgi:hypothetical protein